MLVIPTSPARLSSFAPVSTTHLQRFLVLLVAAVLTTGRRTVSNLLRTSAELAMGTPPAITASSLGAAGPPSDWRGSWPVSSSIIGPRRPSAWPATTPSTSTAAPRSTARLPSRPGPLDHSYTPTAGHKWVVLAILVRFRSRLGRGRCRCSRRCIAIRRRTEGQGPAKKPRRKKAKDRAKVKAKERARCQAEAEPRRGQEAKEAGARPARRHKTPSN